MELNRSTFHCLEECLVLLPRLKHYGGTMDNKELNSQALSHYLTYLATPAPMTLYKNI